MDITAVRIALAARGATISGLRGYPEVLDAVDPPAFIVAEYEIDFDQTFARGLDLIDFTCWLRVSRASERAGQRKLDSYFAGAGGGSLKQAIEADRQLGGIVSNLRVTGVHSLGQYPVGDTPMYGANIDIRVWGAGS